MKTRTMKNTLLGGLVERRVGGESLNIDGKAPMFEIYSKGRDNQKRLIIHYNGTCSGEPFDLREGFGTSYRLPSLMAYEYALALQRKDRALCIRLVKKLQWIQSQLRRLWPK